VALFEYLIKTYTDEGDIVLDNCMGSGTTAIACINTNRNYIGFELDKKYFDIANKRIEECTRQVKLC
jgi:site-specific DNA-methyltransferase (adenine-specific)